MTFAIESLKESDVETAVNLFHRMVDELYAASLEAERLHFKDIYPVEEVKKRLSSKDCIYLIGKEDGKIVGFIFAWVSERVGNIYWLGVEEGHREKGYGSKLLEETMKIFRDRGCYEAKLFTYPSEKVAYHLFQKHGFKETAFIDRRFFGVSIILMVRKITPIPEEHRSKKIVLAGEAGQGIKLMAHVLADILAKLGKEVSLNLIYDATVRGGNIRAEIVYSDDPIDVPFFEEADIGLQLAKTPDPSVRAKHVLIESSACDAECQKCELRCPASDRIPFEKLATEQFNSPIFVNMIALGRLLSKIGINIETVNFASEFPSQFLDENIKAIRYGYTYQD
ncbi:MAG: GNAT family N-acetyltransferase [Planctomycetota bacterium]|nr:GNAT family N-acetyltransferase [Planctomycetota bacterium]MDE1889882.1 GNAT family N-acetyltransferase [Planctomycetota bacterium]MDE2217676.1 GNAT family N-acetyltransferase [Planctomycetota bacterium]